MSAATRPSTPNRNVPCNSGDEVAPSVANMGVDATRTPGRRTSGRRAGAFLILLSVAYPFVLPRLSSHPMPRLLPAVIGLYLCGVFAWTLHRGPPMFERFARMVDHDLPDFTLPYCRRMTMVWSAFFLGNAATAVALATLGPPGWWSAYTGVLAYVLVGLLMVGELCVRKWWFRQFGSGPLDRAFARLFPPEQTANGRRSLAFDAERHRGVTRAENSSRLGSGHGRYSQSS